MRGKKYTVPGTMGTPVEPNFCITSPPYIACYKLCGEEYKCQIKVAPISKEMPSHRGLPRPPFIDPMCDVTSFVGAFPRNSPNPQLFETNSMNNICISKCLFLWLWSLEYRMRVLWKHRHNTQNVTTLFHFFHYFNFFGFYHRKKLWLDNFLWPTFYGYITFYDQITLMARQLFMAR